MEMWASVKGCEDYYEVSTFGRVKRVKAVSPTWSGRILTPVIDGCGYERVKLSINSKMQTRKVHRLVLAAFVGESGLEVNHKNGVRNDNRLENLEYLTHAENIAYSSKVLKNFNNKGTANPRATINSDIAREMRSLAPFMRRADIASRFGVKKSLVDDVVLGRCWAC